MKVALELPQLDLLMPMHAVLRQDRRLAHAGPTLRKLAGGHPVLGLPFDDVFDTGAMQAGAELSRRGSITLRLRLGHRTRLRGFVLPLDGAGLTLLNLSFAVSELGRLDEAGLSVDDFAPNDSIVDMLYLIEANTAVMAEARRLIGRLRGAADTATELAVTDTLTGLRNRRALEQAMARLVEWQTPFALVHLDLDLFKAVNDTHGHAAGDAVLRHVAKVLRDQTRATDTVARIGGDEFVIVLNEQTDPAQIQRIATRIIERVEQPVQFKGRECRVSTSLGTTLSTWYERPDPDHMLADADKALYAAKAAGRGCHRFWQPDGVPAAPVAPPEAPPP